MARSDGVAERTYARPYRVSGRGDLHQLLVAAVERSGGAVLYASSLSTAPVYLGIEVPSGERLGLLCYPFRCTQRLIRNRPEDEHRAQIRFGSEESWEEDHPLGRDVAGVDVTLVLALHPDADLIVGLDPLLYDPLPMGISIEFKEAHVAAVRECGWDVWQRTNRAGTRRTKRRSLSGSETVVAFRPERLLDYARLERDATSLGLDPLLRYKAAIQAASAGETPGAHALEEVFALTSAELMDIIQDRFRLQVAVRGGVAEYHLRRVLERDQAVRSVREIDEDGRPDLLVELQSGRKVLVECKNGSARSYANGDGRVEVQKTRSSKGNPASRLYYPEQFDLVAVCVWDERGPPSFRFKHAERLQRDKTFSDRIAPVQRVDSSWSPTLLSALAGM